MKHNIILLGIFACLQRVQCHYSFPSLIVNGTVTKQWQYVRDVGYDKGAGAVYGKPWPLYDVTSNDMICNRDIGAGPSTATATVVAGSEVGFRVAPVAGLTTGINHRGPGQIYMSKSTTDDVRNYDGKGDWFKIKYFGPTKGDWELTAVQDIKFTIPKTTPPGEYLLRIEHLYVLDRLNETQFYLNCAQVNVVGPGGGKPTDFIRFPGGYKATDPGILITTSQLGGADLDRYKPPGPAVWQG